MRPISVDIKKSTKPEKKFMAVFSFEDGKTKTVHFGAAGYSDFTKHKDEARKKRYIERHERHEDWSDPMTPGALSRYILWNLETLQESITDYKVRFKLK